MLSQSLLHLPAGTTEADLKCVCTWCVFKSNKYSVVKKHIEVSLLHPSLVPPSISILHPSTFQIHHEKKKHYSCKECPFVGQNVTDYAEHYHAFHRTDTYPHVSIVRVTDNVDFTVQNVKRETEQTSVEQTSYLRLPFSLRASVFLSV